MKKIVLAGLWRWRFLVVASLAFAPAWGLSGDFSPGILQAWLGVLLIHGAIPLIDHVLPLDASPPRQHGWVEVLLPVLCLPLWLAALVMGLIALPDAQQWAVAPWHSTAVSAGIIATLGATGGILAINPAHELIHRIHKAQRAVGGALLASVAYGAFKIEHIRGHHLRVATAADTATAQLGETVYRFIARSINGTLSHAYHLDKKQSIWLGLGTLAIWATLLGIWRLFDPWQTSLAAQLIIGFLVLGLVALLAIIELELINYIEHYGLQRGTITVNGVIRTEPVQEHHSWNVNTPLLNAYLFNLQRHSDHHAHAARPYVALRTMPQAPQLPANYGLMILLSLIPPWWKKVMDPKVAVWRNQAHSLRPARPATPD
jgi:alkane 1-monooxygenase